MIHSLPNTPLSQHDKLRVDTIDAFLDERLQDRASIEWAVRLKPTQYLERYAVVARLARHDTQCIPEPWSLAWELIVDSWQSQPLKDHDEMLYDVKRMISQGVRSDAAITQLAALVAPHVTVSAHTQLHLHFVKPRSRPKYVSDLYHCSIGSGDVVDPYALGLNRIQDVGFLRALFRRLDAALQDALYVRSRLGWMAEYSLGDVYRVYYVASASSDNRDPDRHHRGIAPVVKMLHAAAAQLMELRDDATRRSVSFWRDSSDAPYVRLWAALARNPYVSNDDETAAFLLGCASQQYWRLHEFPEIAELRARRFSALTGRAQKRVLARIMKLPPKSLWARETDSVHLAAR